MKTLKSSKEHAMALVAFDTLAYAKRLIAAGFSAEQAEAQAELQSQILSELLINKLATKEDLKQATDDLELKIQAVDVKIDHVEERLNVKMDALDVKINHVEEKMMGKFNLLYWMMGFVLSALITMLFKMFA